LQKFWTEPDPPTDQHVLGYIKRLDTQRQTQESTADATHSTWESPPNPLCAASFGDSGMTATVNAYGLLMQFGDYLGIGSSGLFTADHDYVSEPYWIISRAEDLDGMTRAPSLRHESYGLSLSGSGFSLKPNEQPKLSWKQWRWPCFKYGPEQFNGSSTSLTVDWMVNEKTEKNEKTLLQKCILETSANEDSEIAIKFLKNLRIRDLDHMASNYDTRFNNKEKTHLESGPGPGKCTWIWRAPYTPLGMEQEEDETKDLGQTKAAVLGAQDSGEKPVDKDPENEPSDLRRQPMEIRLGYFQHEGVQPPKISITEATEKQDLDALADEHVISTEETTNEPRVVVVVAAVFVNGVPKQFQNEQDWSSPQTWTENLRKGSGDVTDATKRLEVVTAYRMLLRPQSDVSWKDLIIKAEDIDMDCFTKTDPLRPEHLPSIGGHIELPPPSNTDMKYETKLHKGQDRARETESPSKVQSPSITISPSKVKNLVEISGPNSSPSDHIEFLIWRNLEHILSVCSVPVGSVCSEKLCKGLP
jgi:hypothetical protein